MKSIYHMHPSAVAPAIKYISDTSISHHSPSNLSRTRNEWNSERITAEFQWTAFRMASARHCFTHPRLHFPMSKYVKFTVICVCVVCERACAEEYIELFSLCFDFFILLLNFFFFFRLIVNTHNGEHTSDYVNTQKNTRTSNSETHKNSKTVNAWRINRSTVCHSIAKTCRRTMCDMCDVRAMNIWNVENPMDKLRCVTRTHLYLYVNSPQCKYVASHGHVAQFPLDH